MLCVRRKKNHCQREREREWNLIEWKKNGYWIERFNYDLDWFIICIWPKRIEKLFQVDFNVLFYSNVNWFFVVGGECVLIKYIYWKNKRIVDTPIWLKQVNKKCNVITKKYIYYLYIDILVLYPNEHEQQKLIRRKEKIQCIFCVVLEKLIAEKNKIKIVINSTIKSIHIRITHIYHYTCKTQMDWT